MTRRIQSVVGFDPANKKFLEDHTENTGESMSEFINRLLDKCRGKAPGESSVTEVPKKDEMELKARLFLKENEHIVYRAKKQHKVAKQDILKLKDEMFFSKYKIDMTAFAIKAILRDAIEAFDVDEYEKSKNLKKRGRL